ncbi:MULTISPECIES: prepilin-type N-terminal cleavage/methylation domain-containing protein [Colwellia]|uniref:MSHA biogenesis protein MshC n=1 Tax=Colwellia marinimaniae TaxID=1513592 RepID=A0ABQ0MPY1_9GAMM|nr:MULTISPECIES: prepilin-type N-terminal cleavage/methylation domain-containing protein [Colwellia]GAW94420.1 MSHA biogenesis protein MshC [Colwellia marinimaniae]
MNICKIKYLSDNGFTLIELIVVIILISIMAVTVLPKFFTSNGFEEFTYRDELITKLRAIQLRAMQQTTDDICKNIQVEIAPSAIIGLQATDPDTNLCTTGYAGDTTTVTVDAKHSVSFTLSEGLTSFSFSSLGKPIGCTPVNSCGMTITITGENSPKILINSEGYIYAI